MPKSFILYGTSIFLLCVGVLFIKNGLRKKDFTTAMKSIQCRPIRNYGKGYSIALGILCVILGVVLLTMKPK